MQEIRNHFQEIIFSIFPEAENRQVVPHSDLIIELSWLLNNDPDRENKISKTLRIIVSEEQIDDYDNLTDNQKMQFDKNFLSIISARKSLYDPNHEKQRGQLPPTEEWPIVV